MRVLRVRNAAGSDLEFEVAVEPRLGPSSAQAVELPARDRGHPIEPALDADPVPG